MSTNRLPARFTRRITASPEICAKILGEHLQIARRNDGRPIEDLAPLAGMTTPEWKAIEAGEAPDTWEFILMMGAVLHMGPRWMLNLAHLYKGARRS